MINRTVQLGGSSNPSLPLENCVTSEQNSFPPGVCFPICKWYQPQGVVIKFEKCFAQYLAHGKHPKAMSGSPQSLTDSFNTSWRGSSTREGSGRTEGPGVAWAGWSRGPGGPLGGTKQDSRHLTEGIGQWAAPHFPDITPTRTSSFVPLNFFFFFFDILVW